MDRFDGSPEQWEKVPHVAFSSSQHLEELKAVQKNGKLYAIVKGPSLHSKGTWYIDIDGNEKTGLSIPYWDNSTGVDVKIENGEILIASDGNWIKTGPATTAFEGSTYEMEVDLSQFSSYANTNIRIAFAQPGSEYLPSPGGLMLVVPPPAGAAFGPDVKISVDGDFTDWAGVEPAAASLDNKTTLYAAQDEANLYVTVKGRMAEFNDIFIDTDRSSDTGYTDAGWPLFGGDWLIENGGLFKSTGAGWNWGPVDGAIIKYAETGSGDNRVIEYKIPFSDINLSKARTITLGLASNDIRVPETKQNTPLVAPPLPKISVDGHSDEWEGIPAIAGQGKVTFLKAFARNNKIAILAQAASFDEETNLFIDSDNNPETGYQGWEYKRTGADYLVQNGNLYKSTNTGWAWDLIGPIPWVTAEAAQTGQKLLEMEIDLSSFSNAAETMRVALGVGGDYAPALNSEGEYALAMGPSGGSITTDGKDEDWANIDQGIKGKGETISLKAAQDANKVYLLVEGKNVNTQNTFYLDTDANADTGIKATSWSNFGPDAKIQYNHLFLLNKKKNDWEDKGPVHAEITSDYALFYFYQDQIGRQLPKPFRITFVGKNAYNLPALGQGPLELTQGININQKTIGYEPKENFNVLNNPFMGWVGWANTDKTLVQPHSLVYANITWRELEPEKGKYNWEEIENKFQFEKWKKEGTRINLRFVLDDPGNGPEKDIPDWLYNELIQTEGTDGAGKWYDTPPSVVGKGFSPNYSSPLLIAEHERAIKALAERYNNDHEIAFVQIGSLGHWGEFHNWPEEVSGKFPNLSVSDQYVEHYLKYFTNKMLGMRKPFPIASTNKLGLFNDVFGSKGATDTWVDWTVNGWNEIGPYVDKGEVPATVQRASKMPDFWKYAYSGGEFHSGNPMLSLSDSTIMETLRQARVSHTSWMGPSSPASLVKGKDVTDSEQANIDLLHSMMGYHFVLESVRHENKASIGDQLNLSMVWNNKGVAPFYFDWPFAVALEDSQGNIVKNSIQKIESVDIRNWLPGRKSLNVDYSLSEKLKPGRYTVLIAILDPQNNQPGIKLAVEGERPDGWTRLDSITLAW